MIMIDRLIVIIQHILTNVIGFLLSKIKIINKI
jgi:hypothetical protein